MTSLADRLAAVRRRISDTARGCGRSPDDVTLIAVSKTHPPEIMRAALEAGHRDFGENRVQEAEGKWPDLRETYPELRLHMIGHIQSNKAGLVVELFDVVHTVDRPRIARALAREMHGRNRSLPCFVQVNTGEEPQKGGAAVTDVPDLVRACRDEHGLEIVGLMCIPPLADDPAPHFSRLASLADRLGLAGLSMGMSGDYETAVRYGATQVRVGTSIFGPRGKRPLDTRGVP